MIYGYLRVSTDKQTVENQRFEITRYCRGKCLCVDKWIEESISGTKTPDKRLLVNATGDRRYEGLPKIEYRELVARGGISHILEEA